MLRNPRFTDPRIVMFFVKICYAAPSRFVTLSLPDFNSSTQLCPYFTFCELSCCMVGHACNDRWRTTSIVVFPLMRHHNKSFMTARQTLVLTRQCRDSITNLLPPPVVILSGHYLSRYQCWLGVHGKVFVPFPQICHSLRSLN